MTRRIKRSADYELRLEIKNAGFIAPPREDQRNWMLNRVMSEASSELEYIHSVAPGFIAGSQQPINVNRGNQVPDDQSIMEDWQIPVMRAMANSVAQCRGDILEIGIGRGIASDFIQDNNPRSHTLVECNDGLFANMQSWKDLYPNSEIHLLHGKWQDCVTEDQQYDGILFHTYPLTEQEFVENVVQGVTFAEHFFDLASRLLRPGGAFTYLSNESDSLSRGHQRALFKCFDTVNLTLIENLDIPVDSRDSLWLREIVHVVAGKSNDEI